MILTTTTTTTTIHAMCNAYYLAPSAARFLHTVAPDIIPPTEGGAVRVEDSPAMRDALKRALDTARARGVRSSLRAALRRFEPEAVAAPRTRAARVFVLWKEQGARAYRVQGTATARGSLANLATAVRAARDGRGRVRVIEAATAEGARLALASFEDGSRSFAMVAGEGSGSDDRRGARVLGLGVAGAFAVWNALGAGAGREVRDANGAAIERGVLDALGRDA